MNIPDQWDLDYDVVVAGYGFAGGWTAVSAADTGARVAIFEKMPHFGGNSILSGGGCSCGTDYEGTLAYLRATCLDATDDEVLDAYAREMVGLRRVMEEFAREVGFETYQLRGGATYHFPGWDQFELIRFTRNDRYVGFPWVSGVSSGATHMWILHEHVQKRDIAQYYNAPVQRLITDAAGAVIGVTVAIDGRILNVRARRGVVLCTGGFEHNARLIAHYLQIRHAAAMSPLGNTGDGVLMAQKVGAALWHMWHVHGSYGFRVPESPVAIRTPFGGYRHGPGPNEKAKMPWIAVDRFGQRFMNEWPVACADTPMRDLEHYDFEILDYPRVPCYLIFDDVGRAQGPIGVPKYNDETLTFRWSQDNFAEVDKGYIVRSDSLEELAQQRHLPAHALRESVDRWNDICEQEEDPDHHRTAQSMMPIKTPPYYSIEAWPIITNTQGGPVHDAQQRVLDPFKQPIPRLYEAGELGAIWGHVYLLSGNVLECIIGGRIAGREAASEQPWCTVEPEGIAVV